MVLRLAHPPPSSSYPFSTFLLYSWNLKVFPLECLIVELVKYSFALTDPCFRKWLEDLNQCVHKCVVGQVSFGGGTESENVISGDIIASTVLGTPPPAIQMPHWRLYFVALLIATLCRVERGVDVRCYQNMNCLQYESCVINFQVLRER